MAETAPTTDQAPASDVGTVSATASAAGPPRVESRTRRLYLAALGPVNTASYLDVFERFDAVGRSWLVWHPAAGFFTWGWLVFRRLWAEAMVYGLLVIVLAGGVLWAWPVLQTWPPGVRWGVLGFLLLLSVLLPGLTGYGLVHRQVQRRALRAVAAANTMDEARSTLARQAASLNRLWALVPAYGVVLAAFAGVWFRGPWPSTGGEHPVASRTVPATTVTTDAQTLQAVGAEALAPPAPSAALPPAPTVKEVVAQAESTGAVASPAPGQTVFSVVEASDPKGTPTTSTAPPPLADRVRDGAAVTTLPAATSALTVSEPAMAFAINVGLFASEGNAQRAQARLQAAGLPVVVQVINTPKGPLTRVRVGPYRQRETADAAAEQIRQQGLEAVVFGQ